MRKNLSVVWLTVFVVMLFAGGAQAFEVFFWQKDNALRINDPVFETSYTVTQSLTRTLGELDIDYTVNTRLPDAEDLECYDLVMTSLSFFCPG